MDPYETLGVRRAASEAEIRRAYQKHARRLHPDVNPGDPAAATRFRQVVFAFEVLSDRRRRAEYDRDGRLSSPDGQHVPEVGFAGFDFSAETAAGALAPDFQDLFGASSLPGAVPAPAAGENVEHVTRLTFEEAYRGTRRRVHLVRHDVCSACGGSGDVPFGPVACPKCQGAGELRARRGHMVFTRRCAACGARGRIERRPCGRCGAEGRVMQSEWLEVVIPPGVDHGSRVSVPGAGNAGVRGGPAGDFSLVVEVEAHAFYRREKDDLYCTVPLTVSEAALGGHVEVPAPDGPVTIEIPAGTQPGQRFRLRKRGMPRAGGKQRGDLYVEASVCVPRLEDERSRELLRQLAQLNPQDPRRELTGWDLRTTEE